MAFVVDKCVFAVEPMPSEVNVCRRHRFINNPLAFLWDVDLVAPRSSAFRPRSHIHLGSRQIWISLCTESATGDWPSHQSHNFQMHIDEHDLQCTILMRDRNPKYTDSFDNAFKSNT
jgi:putative transposase